MCSRARPRPSVSIQPLATGHAAIQAAIMAMINAAASRSARRFEWRALRTSHFSTKAGSG